jgi:uncharacterized protein (DUF2062 family)
LSMSIALGIVFGLFPVVGITSFMCFAISIPFRLNLLFIQVVNYIVYPLQLLLIIPYLKFGHILFHFSSMHEFNLTSIQQSMNQGIGSLFTDFGMLFLSAILFWLILAIPFSIFLYYFSLKHIRKLKTNLNF